MSRKIDGSRYSIALKDMRCHIDELLIDTKGD